MTIPEIPFLEGLDPVTAAAVRSRCTVMTVGGGGTVFAEGEAGDALYTVVSGAVGLTAADPDGGGARRLARLVPPETFGEMSLLSAELRSTTATALRDTRLLRLSREAFDEVVAHHPGTLEYFANQLSVRLRAAYTRRAFRQPPRCFAVIAVTQGPCATAFGQRLATAFDASAPGRTGCLAGRPEGVAEGWFHDYEARHARTILVVDRIDGSWCRDCLGHADHVMLLAYDDASLRPGVAAVLDHVRSDWIRVDLVVQRAEEAASPRAPHPEVAALPVAMRLHVRCGHGGDHARLGRIVGGKARSLVLGGGGARAFAHIGVLKALEEAGLPVDLVGGTSMGGIIAASVATGLGSSEILSRTVAFFVRHNPLHDYTLPFHALIRGRKVDAGLLALFGNTRIEDLLLPFFCVSSNLSSAAYKVHDYGPLTQALRASSSIPGLLPAVVADDGVLVDGGMMNNLPADVMASLDRGPVLAVDVGSDRAFHGAPHRSRMGHLVRRMLGLTDTMPGLVPLLLRAATVSSAAQAAMAAKSATVVLKPPLAGVDLRAWSSVAATAELGYRHARHAIATGALDDWG